MVRSVRGSSTQDPRTNSATSGYSDGVHPKGFASTLPRQGPHEDTKEEGSGEGAFGPENLSSPASGSAPGSRHGGDDVVGRARDEGVDPSVGPRERRLTTEELAYYHQLRREGVDPEEARAKVLGDDDGMRS